MLERTLESPLKCKEIKLVNIKGNQPWIFIGRTDTEALILWPPDAKSWLIGKDPDAGENWGQEKGVTGDDGLMTSPTQRIWLWANSRRQWRTRRPGVLQFMGSQRVGQDLVAEQQQPKPFCYFFFNALSYLFITFFSCPLLAYMNTFFLVLHFVSLWLFKYFPCSILLNYWVWFDIQSQRKAMPKNAQTTTQLHSSHMLVK